MPATPTYVALAEVTLAATATSVTLPVPTGYRDLIIIVKNLAASGDYSVRLQFNGDTGSNYSFVQMYGNGSSTFSNAATLDGILGTFSTSTGWSQTIFQVMDYSATDKHKTVLTSGGQAGVGVRSAASRWANTSAITSVKILTDGNSFEANSTFMMYGIEA